MFYYDSTRVNLGLFQRDVNVIWDLAVHDLAILDHILDLAPVAIVVNFVASLPGAARSLATGRVHSRVPSTILIAIGAFFPAVSDSLVRFGFTGLHEIGLFLGVVFLFLGFLVSSEVFREIRIPFTPIRLRIRHQETLPAEPTR